MKIIKDIVSSFLENDVMGKSAMSAYYLVFAIFPIALLIVSLLPLLNVDVATLNDFLYAHFNSDFADIISDIFLTVLTEFNGYIALGAFLITIWAASAATGSIVKNINSISNNGVKRNFLVAKLISLGLTILFLVYVVIVFILGILTSDLVEYFIINETILNIINIVTTYFILPLVMGGMLLIFYYFAPSGKRAIKYAIPGVIFWVLSFNVVVRIFDFYLSNIANFHATYGAFAGIILFIFVCYVFNIFILLGAVINEVIYNKN